MTQETAGRVNVQDKRIFGGKSDLNQLVPFRYTWAWDAYLESNKNHWLPGHFHFDLDKVKTDTEQTLVLELYLAWRLAISKVVREALPTLYRATTAPECRQYMLRHMQEESVAIKAITESNLLDLPNMGLWVDAMVERITNHFPDHLTMLAHDYALFVSAMVVYKGYVLTAMETWLMKEVELPVETRKFIQALQTDGVGQRNFYTNLLATFLNENPAYRNLVKSATLETAVDEAITGYRLHWFNHDLTHLVDGPATQFGRHCWTTCLTSLGIPVKVVASPYKQQMETSKAGESQNPLTWD